MKPTGRSRLYGAVTAVAGVKAVAGVVVVTVVTALLAGCASGSSGSSSASSANSGSPGSASSAAATSAAATASAASAPASPSAPAASVPGAASSPANPGPGTGTPQCATRNLQASAGVSQGAAGSIYQVIDLKNISGAPCTLFGYPGVSLAGGTPVTEIGPGAARSTANPATTITLAAGATANALLRIGQAGNYPVADCHPVASTYIQIYPPDQTTPIYLAYASTACAKTTTPPQLTIGVMQTGSGSNGG